MTSSSSPNANAVLVMDRFVSASSAQDAVESLQGMVDGLKSNEEPWDQEWILKNIELADHLTYLLQNGTLKNGDLPCGEEGINLVCQLYQTSLASHPDSLQQPAPGQLLEALLDVMDNSERQIYTRVLALQVLEELSRKHSNVASPQWLQAPNGLHRLADLLSLGVENPMEEVVRNQALLVASILAREAPISKVFLFAEVECKLLDLCWQQGGLTKGSSIVMDALNLIQEMLKHADAALQDLVWQRPSVPSRLAQLIDLRGADEFLHPENYTHKIGSRKNSEANTKSSRSNSDDDGDDLDSLLQSGENKKKQTAPSDEQIVDVYTPRLSSEEELIVDGVLKILGLLLETESLQPSVWKQHAGMCSLVWELALVNPANPPVCGIPSADLQQKALELVATKFNDILTMDRHAGLDRLLYLVCTGGGNAKTYQEKMGLSQAALAVLRQTLNGERIHNLLLHTLAPPPQEEEEEGVTPGPTVVQKLWNTVVENLAIDAKSESEETRSLFLAGALGGLSLMLYDEQSREIMTRLVPDEANADVMLEALQRETDSVVQWSLLRFLCEWIKETPLMVQKLLSSTASTNLASMAASFDKDYIPLVHLLLGLAMEYLPDDEEDCGGWTRSGILQMIQNVGISKYTSSLEAFKKVKNGNLPCFVCDSEYNHWVKWYNQAVWVVRKRVVQELAGGNNGDDSEGEDEKENGSQRIDSKTNDASVTSGTNSGIVKPFRKLISQQAKEIDSLREELELANVKIKSQEHQLNTWQRRMESNPTELDTLLSEMTSKTASLEESISRMESESKQSKLEYEENLSALNTQLLEVRQQASESRTSEQEARDDRERMEQELSALSQAYASLEEEYQRERKSNVNVSSTGAPTGEDVSQQQSEGEGSNQEAGVGSTEIATLRAENSRLRTNAKAADDWMKMAVNRMNEMGAQSNTLEQQVDTLTGQIKVLQSQEATKAQEQETQLRIEQERNESEWRQQLSNLESQLQKERTLRESAEENTSGATAILQSKLENEKKAVAELQLHLSKAQEETRIALKQKEALAHNLEVERTRASNDSRGVSGDMPTNGADNELSTAAALSKDVSSEHLEALRIEFERNKSHLEEEVYKKESIIRELEDRLNSGLGGFKVEDIRTRDEEIEELRAANEAAQDWMAKAVDHHQLLSSQVASLTEEKASIVAKLDKLEREISPANIDDSTIALLKKEVKEKSDLIESIKSDLKKREDEVVSLRSYQEQSKGMKQDLGIAHDDMEILQKKYEESLETVRGLEKRLNVNIAEDEYEKLKVSNADLQERLNQFQSWADTAQKKIAEIMSAKEEADKTSAELKRLNESLEAKNQILSEKLQYQEAEAVRLMTEMQGKTEQIAGAAEPLSNTIGDNVNEDKKEQYQVLEGKLRLAQENLFAQEDAIQQLQDQVTELEAQTMSLNTQLEDQAEDANKAIAQWQDSYSEAENRCRGLEKTLELLQEENNTLEKRIHHAKDGKGGFQEDSAALERVSELEAQVVSLNSQLREQQDDANKAIAQWQESCSESDNRCRELEEEFLHDNRVAELEAQITALNSRLQEQEVDANKAIAQWQESHSESDNRCQALEKTLELLQQEKNTLEKAVQDAKDEQGGYLEGKGALEERVAELEAQIAVLSSQLREQEEDANKAIVQWQESYSETDNRCRELEKALELLQEEKDTLEKAIQDEQGGYLEGKAALDVTIASMENVLDKELDDIKKEDTLESKALEDTLATNDRDANEVIVQLREELAVAQHTIAQDEDIVQQWEVRVSELEATVKSLETQLAEQEEEANNVIAQWQESYSVSDDRCASLNTEVEAARAEIEKLKVAQDNDTVEKQNTNQLEDQVVALKAEVTSLEGKQLAQQTEANSKISALEENYSLSEEKCLGLKAELDEIIKNQGSLRGMTETLQKENEMLKEQVNDFGGHLVEQEKQAMEEQQALADLLKTTERDNERLKTEKLSLEERIGLLEQENSSQQLNETLQKLQAREDELKEVREALANDEEVLKQWEDRVNELEGTIENLESQFQEQENEANMVITSWQERLSEMETARDAELGKLKEELLHYKKHTEETEERSLAVDSLKKDLEEARAKSFYFEQKLASEQEAKNLRVSELAKEIEGLQSEVDESRAEARTFQAALADEKERSLQAREKAEMLDKSLDEIRIESDDNVEQLKSVVEKLKMKLQDQEAETTNVIFEWKNKVSELEATFSNLEEDLRKKHMEEVGNYQKQIEDLKEESLSNISIKSELEESKAKILRLNQQLTSEQEARQLNTENDLRYQEARDEIEGLEKALDELRIESEEVVSQWTERVEELETLVTELEEQIHHQEEEAHEAISSWEAKALDLERDLDASIEEQNKFKDTIQKQNTKIQSMEDEMHQESKKHVTVLEEEKEKLKIKLKILEDELEGTRKELKRMKDIPASKSREKLEEERDRLTVVVAQLEEEVREANDMFQAYITDETTERATEITANALRDEIKDLQAEIDGYRSQIQNERMAREVAELEMESMREDIATLAALTTQDSDGKEIQLRTADAAEKLRRKERVEMEELRNSLYRAVDELELSQAAERDALESLSKARLQISVCEQEIIAAKSEINFLTQALEETRLTEESKRASLEYRIGSLEDENDVLQKYHAGELEDMRHELSNVTMEKDRILHELRDMEKTNSALVLAASKEESQEKRVDDFEAEIAKLRIENAHLLTVAADDKARGERRLRELLAAQAASTEADAILEHELRVATEESLRNMKVELDQLKKDATRLQQENSLAMDHSGNTEQIESLKEDVVKLRGENETLKKKMEDEASKAKSSVTALTEECRRLTEECRMAQSKVHKVERDGRYNAAIKSEVGRVRMSPNVSSSTAPEMRDDSMSFLKLGGPSTTTTSSSSAGGVSGSGPRTMMMMESPSKNAAALDLIQRQKEEIQEERKMYLEFLSEHDDLLALLAQLDVERMCLRDVLTEVGGEEAVSEAMQKAGDKTVMQFGKILNVTQTP